MKTIRNPAARAADLLRLFTAAMLCAAIPAAAQAPPAFPAPESVALARLGYMRDFPPQGEQLIDHFLKTLKKDGEHGAGFVYRTAHSEVLGWIVSRVTGQHFADLLSERV